jgi:hypothetical protein
LKKLRRFSPRISKLIAGSMALLFSGALFFQHIQAAPGQFAISPASSSVLNGNNVTVSLRINPLSEVFGLDVTLSYDAAKLQYVSTNAAGSAFATELPASANTSGKVHVARGITPGQLGVTGDAFIAQVTFKALTGSGNTSLSLGGDVAGPNGAVPTATGTGTVGFTSPTPPPPAPAPSPSPSPSPTPSPTPTPPPTSSSDKRDPDVSITAPASHASISGTVDFKANASDNVAVARVEFQVDGQTKNTDTSSPYSYSLNTTTLSNGEHRLSARAFDTSGRVNTANRDVTVNNSGPTPAPAPSPPPSTGSHKPDLKVSKTRIELTRATLHASSKESVRVYVKYGIGKDRLSLSTPQTDFKRNHDISIPTTTLVPGTTFYYKVVVEDEKGNTAESQVQNFKTRGYRVTFFVGGKNERRLARRKVTLHSEPMTAKTDANGYVTFDNVAPGNHQLEFEDSGQKHVKAVTVEDSVIQYGKDGSQTAKPINQSVIFDNVQVADTTASPILLPASLAAAVALAIGAFVVIRRRGQTLSWQHTDLDDSIQQPPSAGTAANGPISRDDLISRVPGLNKPDPGTVVAPNQHDKDKDQR